MITVQAIRVTFCYEQDEMIKNAKFKQEKIH